ncbi:unnamed protein product [Paramecium pentaurelia]|uniref:Uncharacterized protein n=1 Tax=Paramecium pentaurelia TaxID=43138 RepID=A0A8S1XDG4_9CILI|nr:unnamed protein product [Paramecium pentaurelia]
MQLSLQTQLFILIQNIINSFFYQQNNCFFSLTLYLVIQIKFKKSLTILNYQQIEQNYLNVLNYHNGDLISSKNKNQFNDHNDGSPFRDEIYLVTSYFGFLMCSLEQSIQINLIQKYELNTLKIWLWDRNNRFYTMEVFIIFENVETRIYENNQAQSILTIKFPAQKVESFRKQMIYKLNQKLSNDYIQYWRQYSQFNFTYNKG